MAKVVGFVEVTTWGRRGHASWKSSIGALLMIILAPSWITINWIALQHFEGSLQDTIISLLSTGPLKFVSGYGPQLSTKATVGYLCWLVFQALLYSKLPGPISKGQLTPAGNLLSYKTNGLLAWKVSHLIFVGGSLMAILDPSIIARHWEGLLITVNVYGILLATFAQFKAYLAPSHPEDCKFTGSILYDYFMGIELNPRWGDSFDFKLFYNGRPGIIAWTLIDLSWMAYQYQTYGFITKSMALVTFFHFLYVLDFFYNEAWYLKTIDITHDHFGFYLAWGDTAFLPTTYTLQAQYLARYPVHLTNPQSLAILLIGLSAYALFRSVNNQKDLVRCNPSAHIWGRPATYITAKYSTSNGQTHTSLLITSGWWGFSRHANYLGDLVLSWAMCATCGTQNLLPWTYFFFMGVLLYHRIRRDEKRCREKYGKYWGEYEESVGWKLLPGVW